MFKKSLLLIVALAATLQVSAADVNLATAQNVARSFLTRQVANGHLKATAINNLTLVKAEASVAKPEAVDYYIFNSDKSYVVIAGDDLAPEILMYGVEGTIDLNNIPPAMQWMLNKYKYQIDGIKAGTLKATGFSPKATTPVAPLVTANWDQSAPYNNQCPTSGGSRAVTGCPATSLAMCYYKWKWPTTFPACDAINGSVTEGYSAPALPEREADWDNIIDEYTGPTNYNSNAEQKDAVAWLMRYAGQSIPDYYYSSSASGANDPEIYQGVLNMGYTDAQYLLLTELIGSGWSYTNGPQQYTDAEWNEFMLNELYHGRPIEYLAYDCSGWQPAGHAFNVFGCDSNGKYYVNWGWSGDSNGYCTLHNFTTATGSTGQSGSYVFNYGEAMIIGIEPPGGIKVNPTELEYDGYVGETYTKTITVMGRSLESDISLTLSGDAAYSISHTTITSAQAADGVDVTITYAPTAAGNHNATITLSCDSEEEEDVVVTITGVAHPRVPTLVVEPANLEFSAALGKTVTKTFTLTGPFLTHDVTLTLNDTKGVFTVSPTTISQSSTDVNTPVTVVVSFNSAEEGSFNGSITIASEGAESKTVNLTAIARDGGAATDPFLNIAYYETIDEAGANVSGMNTIYKYTEYEDQECAWLTVSNYGALKADDTQNWITSSSLSTYNNSWSATDVFPGQNAYFGSSQAYSVYGNNYQSFYVTNCTQVKAYVKGGSYSSSSATLAIYECTLNANGSITPSSTAVDTKQVSSGVATSAELDASKIYMVKLTGGGSYPDLLEIGFQTPLSTIEVPVALPATEVAANGFTASWTICPSATSYTLRVVPKPAATLLMTETFEKCVSAGGQDIGGSLNNYLDNPGWTGSKVYTAVGGVRLGTASGVGTLTSPALDLSADNKVSIRMKAQTLNNDTDCGLKVSCGEASETITVPNNETGEYTIVLDCTAANQKVTFETTTNSKRVIITDVELYSGDVTKTTAKGFDETIFTNITDLNYKVTGLQPGTTYLYDVKAVNADSQSKWSNKIEVVTLSGTPGDANGDGAVDVNDVTAVISYILGKNPEPFNIGNADLNGDGEVNVNDVTLIIGIILAGK
ncbi:MAG: C10 family peptidase [Muribaculaceae bacterium]|nr:C10 family peptidase [Muribaculaceae bacterium]